ncbi:MAG: hypothetical protein JOZ68_08600 [Acidimicrobiia bacterium]|nr:hypothetical protein [Acidimicrobiia bacterium]MBV8985925.1 hypothetical protein [Acidimicrobiia bacterium]MBV9041051.1 hypothetical protein [Acidimicrobiia bacterium]MBV9283144.1 hypothetical protein [Acidimicrobiia bacterium]
MRTRLVLALTVAVVGASLYGGHSNATAAAASRCIARITQFAFSPSTAPEGSNVTLSLQVQNCSRRSQTLTLTRFGTEPRGCPVIDPITKGVTIKARSTYTESTPMTAPPCEGTERISERVSKAGILLEQSEADLQVTAAGH